MANLRFLITLAVMTKKKKINLVVCFLCNKGMDTEHIVKFYKINGKMIFWCLNKPKSILDLVSAGAYYCCLY